MNNFGSSGQGDSSLFDKALKGLSYVMAGLAAFFLGPLLYGASAGWVMDFTYRHYGVFIDAPFYIGWAHVALSGLVAFFGTQMLLALIVPLLSGKLSLRMMG